MHQSAGNPLDPGSAAPLPPFSRCLFSVKSLPEIAARSEQPALQIAPLLSKGSAVGAASSVSLSPS